MQALRSASTGFAGGLEITTAPSHGVINNPLTSVLLNLRSIRKQLVHITESSRPPAMRCLEDLVAGSERIADGVRAL
ncbi:MAG: hypothetical protein AB7P03_17540 [Kofleriaceae bacterium]